MNAKEFVEKVYRIGRKDEELESKERSFQTEDGNWRVRVYYNRGFLTKGWRVSVRYKDHIEFKSFKNYEDALRFYEECVKEIKRRCENAR